MRRLSLMLLAALAVLPASALAGRSATGDGVFELRNVAAKVTIVGKGAIWGQLSRGTLVVTDPNPDDNLTALVSGTNLKKNHSLTKVDGGVTTYTAKNLRFRFAGGK